MFQAASVSATQETIVKTKNSKRFFIAFAAADGKKPRLGKFFAARFGCKLI
jgi:hypothetical protein